MQSVPSFLVLLVSESTTLPARHQKSVVWFVTNQSVDIDLTVVDIFGAMFWFYLYEIVIA